MDDQDEEVEDDEVELLLLQIKQILEVQILDLQLEIMILELHKVVTEIHLETVQMLILINYELDLLTLI